LRETICAIAGTIGGLAIWMFGGWNASLTTLLLFMGVDYVMGLLVAGVFKRSPKTTSGGLQSKTGWKGLFKKCVVLLFVMVAARIDITLETTYIRNAVCIGFACNELISIIENAGLMGIPLPDALLNAVDILQKKTTTKYNKEEETKNDDTDVPKQ
jgi:toxin secretion/phage lysis holin